MYFAKYSGYSINNGACSQAFHCDFERFAMEFSVLRYFIRICCIFCTFPRISTFCCPLLNFHPFFFNIYFPVFCAIIVEYFLYIFFYTFFFFFHIYSTHGWYIFRSFITFSYGSLYFIESLNGSGFFEYYLKKKGSLSERKKCVKGD